MKFLSVEIYTKHLVTLKEHEKEFLYGETKRLKAQFFLHDLLKHYFTAGVFSHRNDKYNFNDLVK